MGRLAPALVALAIATSAAPAAADERVQIWGDPSSCVELVRGWLADRADVVEGREPPAGGAERQAWLKSRMALGVYLAAGRDSVRVFVFRKGVWRGLRVWSLAGKGCRIGAREVAASRRWLEARLFGVDAPLPAPEVATSTRAPPRSTGASGAAAATGAARTTPPPRGGDPSAGSSATPHPQAEPPSTPRLPELPPRTEAPRTEPTRTAPARRETIELPGDRARPSPRAAVAPPSPPRTPSDARAALALGVALGSYRFAYDAPATANTRELAFGLVPQPALAFEVRPADGALAPLVVRGRLAAALGLEATRTEGGGAHGMQYVDSELAIGWRIPLEAWWAGARVEPMAGARYWLARVGADAAGLDDPDAPSFGLWSLTAGLELAFPIRGAVTGHVGARYAQGLATSGALTEPAFFPGAGAIGLVAGGGVELHFADAWALSLDLRYALARWGLSGVGTAARVADAATATAWAPALGLVAHLF